MLQLYSMSICDSSRSWHEHFAKSTGGATFECNVGQLLWLSDVRPDIMFAVQELSRGLSAPTSEHECKVTHLLRFLAGTKHFTQQLRPTLSLSPQHKGPKLQVFVDSDWAASHETRRPPVDFRCFVFSWSQHPFAQSYASDGGFVLGRSKALRNRLLNCGRAFRSFLEGRIEAFSEIEHPCQH